MRGTKLICDQCGLPVAEVIGDVLVIFSRHHGKKHRTVIPVSNILVAMEDKLSVDTPSENEIESM